MRTSRTLSRNRRINCNDATSLAIDPLIGNAERAEKNFQISVQNIPSNVPQQHRSTSPIWDRYKRKPDA